MSEAKVTPPRVSRPGTVPRERLFARLDRGLERGAAWVQGPAGAGKTTLVASWLEARRFPVLWYRLEVGDGDPATFFHFLGLAFKRALPRRHRRPPAFTPERIAALAAFTRGWIDHLGSRGPGPVVVVLDDVHVLPEGSPLDDVLRVAFAMAPPGSAVMGLSRSRPPPPLMRGVAAGAVEVVRPEDLRLDDREAAAIVAAFGIGAPGREPGLLPRLLELCDGWPAGLAFLLDPALGGRTDALHVEHVARGGLFDYLATEVLAAVDGRTRRLLLRTAHLQGFTAALARAVSGVADAARILGRLARDGTFTRLHEGERPSYSYHPLFRAFLVAAAERALDPAQRRRLLVESARHLAREGRPDAAAALYRQAGAPGALAALAVRSAPELLAEGRAQTLAEWLGWLPDADVEADPWLLYWRAQGLFASSPLAAHEVFASALEGFRARGDGAGSLLAWAGAVCAIWGAGRDLRPLDDWVRTGEELLAAFPGFPSPEVELEVASAMCVALVCRQPWSPALPLFRARVLALASAARKMRLRVPFASMAIVMHDVFHRGALVDAAHATAVLLPAEADASAPAVVRTAAQWARALVLFFEGRFAESRRAAEVGLRLVQESEIRWFEPHLLAIAALGELPGRDPGAGAGALAKARARLQPSHLAARGFVHLVAGWFALATGDPRAAWTHAERRARIRDDVGMVLHAPLLDLVQAIARHDLGERAEAHAALERGRALAREQACPFYVFAGALAAADLLQAEGREAAALAPLAEALAFARQRGFALALGWRRERATRLLALALAEGIEVECARRLIEVHDLAAEPPDDLEAWPWPVRVRTLGALAIEVSGRSLPPETLRGKPAELLRALVALGAVEVPEIALTDAIWPDSGPDAAHSAFSTNLQRLRRLVATEGALLLAESRLSLDPRRVWTDVRAFERAANGIDGLARTTPAPVPALAVAVADLERRAERLLSLYRGAFLVDGCGAACATALRLRLEARFRRAVAILGERLEAASAPAQAIWLYARALERDPLAEGLYERLARAELELGRPAEALAVYARARAALAGAFGVEPGEALSRLAAWARAQGRR